MTSVAFNAMQLQHEGVMGRKLPTTMGGSPFDVGNSYSKSAHFPPPPPLACAGTTIRQECHCLPLHKGGGEGEVEGVNAVGEVLLPVRRQCCPAEKARRSQPSPRLCPGPRPSTHT